MRYKRLYEERLYDFEIMTMDSEPLIGELKEEIRKEDYVLDYIKDLVFYGHFDVDVIWGEYGEEWTFLMKASKLGKADIVKVLLEEGADPNVQTANSYSALHYAIEWEYLQVVRELLSHPQTDPNIKKENDWTALHLASIAGYTEIVKDLLKHPKTDPNIQKIDGWTALHLAAHNDNIDVVKELLQHPDIDIRIKSDTNGCETAWDVARNRIRKEFPELNPNRSEI